MAGAQRVGITWLLLCVLLSLSITADAKRGKKLSLLHRVHTYATTVDTANVSKEFYSYSRAFIKVDKRNPILMLMPSGISARVIFQRIIRSARMRNLKIMMMRQ